MHILDEKWLDASAKLGYPANEKDYCLRDRVKESQWNFTMNQTMYERTLEDRQKLLQKYSFYVTSHKSMRPSANELIKIIQFAGGQVCFEATSSRFFLSNMYLYLWVD